MPIARKATPFWETTDHETVRLYNGDVLETLQRLPSGSVQMVCTSPPYWGLRSYLDSEHEHKGYELGSEKSPDCLGWARGVNCAEENWETSCHVCRMVLVFREARRVLRDDGTLWLNYGSSYGQDGQMVAVPWLVALALQADGWILRQDIIWAKPSPMPESVKNRCTKAHEYVFLFAKKGGYFCDMEAVKEPLKTDPEALKKRMELGQKQKDTKGDPTQNSYMDNWSKSTKSYEPTGSNKRSVWLVAGEAYPGAHFATFPTKLITPMIKAGTSEKGCCSECGAPWKRVIEENKLTRERPNDYVKRVPVPGVYRLKPEHKINNTPGVQPQGGMNTCPNTVAGVETRTVGWEPSCECNGRFEKRKVKKLKYLSGSNNQKDCTDSNVDTNVRGISGKAWKEWQKAEHSDADFVEVETRVYIPSIPLEDHPVSPCIVLDPFAGSGTTNAVCITLGRNSIGIELSKDYLVKNAVPRIEGELLARPALAYLVPRAARKSTMVGEDITG